MSSAVMLETAAGDAPSDCRDDKDTVVLLELEPTTSSTTVTLPSTIQQTIHEYRQSNDDKTQGKQRHWKVLLFGQSIAIAAASVNASSYTLEYNLGVVLPIFQMSILYMILSSFLCCRHHEEEEKESDDSVSTAQTPPPSLFYTCPIFKLKLKIPWWMYFFMSLLDVEANYMVLLSLKYTSLTSTTLLGSLTVPSVMICSRWILARVFVPRHYIGVCLCLLGGTIMVWSDNTTREHDPNSYIGDLFAITAAVLYGLGDTVAEYAIKHIDRAEYLGMLGMFGFLISILQCVVLESADLLELLFHTTPTLQLKAFSIMAWYIVSLVFYYVAVSYFLTTSDATLLNLSLQTTSLWASVFDVVANGTIPPLVFFLAVLLVTVGVCVYQVGGERGGAEEGTGIMSDNEDESSSDESETLTSTDQEFGGYMSIEM